MVQLIAKYRATAGRLLLVMLTGYAVLNLLGQNIRLYPGLPETDPITIHEARIAQLRPLLPPSGAVGYITTVENDRIFAAEKSFTNVEFLAQYVLTQYTLAPRIRPEQPGPSARRRQFYRRAPRTRLSGKKRSGRAPGSRRRPHPLPEGAEAMIAFFLASLLLPLIGGLLLTFIFLPSLKNDLPGLILRLFAGGGLGIGLSACLYFIALLTGFPGYIPPVELAACLLLGPAGYVLLKRGRRKAECPVESQLHGRRAALPKTGSKWEIGIAALFAVELLASLGSFLAAFLKEPHGKWDAWLIWNMHARFLYRSGEAWREVFAAGMEWSHWDYPLLLPLSIVRSWKYIGNETAYVPAAFALLFTLLTLGLLIGALMFLRSRIQGYLAAMVLLGTPFFILMGASQFAEVPLAFFMLATLALLFLPARSPENRSGALLLAGIAAGLCAWTKNEGLLFLLIVTGALFGTALHAEGWGSARRQTVRFLAGALPILLIVLYFKTQIAPANDLIEGFGLAAAADKLTDFSRYAEIAKAFLISGIGFTQGLTDIRAGARLNPGAVGIPLMIVYLLLAGARIDDRDRTGLVRTAAVLLLMPAGYFFVYVLTPLDLGYHLATSLNRLFLQLWPIAIFLFFMIADFPERGLSTAAVSGGPASNPSATRPLKGRKPKKTGESK